MTGEEHPVDGSHTPAVTEADRNAVDLIRVHKFFHGKLKCSRGLGHTVSRLNSLEEADRRMSSALE